MLSQKFISYVKAFDLMCFFFADGGNLRVKISLLTYQKFLLILRKTQVYIVTELFLSIRFDNLFFSLAARL